MSVKNSYTENQMKLRAITPELAANVVRDFILPMFENDGKKFIKKKNKKALTKL